ncbi:MAG: hypothetical protein EOO38_12935 [Cytophagaceae bacterium]|nr:MAG: hypothetical protein EOO38_12935 [Cytophagaceae bacterium]
MAMSYRIVLEKENFKFSCSHFTIFSDESCERLHGHNYYVSAEFSLSAVTPDLGLAFDFNEVKPLVREVTQALDEYVLLPAHSPYLKVEQKDNSVRATFAKKHYEFPKEDVEVRAKEISSNLVALVEGYQTITAAQGNWSTMLAYNTAQLDARIFSRFTNRNTPAATHEYARHLLKGLLIPTSELIKEAILAARLGVTTTADGWPRLRDEVFGAARYQGAFGQSWERWWQPEVNRIFESLCGTPIASLDADERVAALVESTGLTELVAATPIELNQSTWYWTICEAYKTPLDPAEGFRLAGSEPTVWQEYNYISLKALLEQLHTTDLHRSLHPDEALRFEAIRDNYA